MRQECPGANCNLGHGVAGEGEDTKPQVTGGQCLARAWEILLEKFEDKETNDSKTKEIYDSVSGCVRSATKIDTDREGER